VPFLQNKIDLDTPNCYSYWQVCEKYTLHIKLKPVYLINWYIAQHWYVVLYTTPPCIIIIINKHFTTHLNMFNC